MSEFSTEARLEVLLDESSMRDARDDLDALVEDVALPVDVQRDVGGGSRIAGRERAMGRQIADKQLTELTELTDWSDEEADRSEYRNELLEQLLDEYENMDGRGRGPGGGGGFRTAGMAIGLGVGVVGAVLVEILQAIRAIDFPGTGSGNKNRDDKPRNPNNGNPTEDPNSDPDTDGDGTGDGTGEDKPNPDVPPLPPFIGDEEKRRRRDPSPDSPPTPDGPPTPGPGPNPYPPGVPSDAVRRPQPGPLTRRSPVPTGELPVPNPNFLTGPGDAFTPSVGGLTGKYSPFEVAGGAAAGAAAGLGVKALASGAGSGGASAGATGGFPTVAALLDRLGVARDVLEQSGVDTGGPQRASTASPTTTSRDLGSVDAAGDNPSGAKKRQQPEITIQGAKYELSGLDELRRKQEREMKRLDREIQSVKNALRPQ